jgi:isoamylase/glycogen operon protein
MHLNISTGRPAPLGITSFEHSLNFAIYSPAKEVFLLFFTAGIKVPFAKVQLTQCTDNVWHATIQGLPSSFDWGIEIEGVLVHDPYARALNTPHEWNTSFYAQNKPLGHFEASQAPFDWEGDAPPAILPQDLVIYEMHVRGFTEDSSSMVRTPGTFLGMIEKIPYLKKLGVNAVELLPIFEFNEKENPHKKLFNYWGYSTVNFFSLMNRYCKAPNDFKQLVKELHKNKIEVILDVVYNHTAEGNENGPTLSFRGLDPNTYYMRNEQGDYLNFTGCGNTFNCNHPVTLELILDSLRYWVTEMHVDGFRFDLASILTRDLEGKPIADPPILRKISEDPLLSHTKFIAEAWDAAGLYQVGTFPSYGKWAEWNGKYRDSVRRFLKGTDNQAGAFAAALSGSQDLYGHGRKPYHSINFVTAHDGFTLRDLVSYNHKHNAANQEHNKDGSDSNDSWNCGHEGPSSSAAISKLRLRQSKNFIVALLVSLGVPMIWMGDEHGHTRLGNNNTWCHDGPLNAFLWNQLEKESEIFRFFQLMIDLRNKTPLFRRTEFLTPQDIDWHGTAPFHPDWSAHSRFVAYVLKDATHNQWLYIAFNATQNRPTVQLPPAPPHRKWYRIADTALLPPHDFIEHPLQMPPLKATCKMEAHSSMILVAL